MSRIEDFEIDMEGYEPESMGPTRSYRSAHQEKAPEPEPVIEPESYVVPETPSAEREERKPKKKEEKPSRREKTKKVAERRDRDASPALPRVLRFFTDERTRIFLAIVLILMSIFSVISIFSYFGHAAHDQSAVINLSSSQIAAGEAAVGNAAGAYGAKFSNLLLCESLGVGSIVLVVYFWILALGLLKLRKCDFWSTTFRCLLLAVTISMVLGLVTYTSDSVIYLGGKHGHYMNKLLIDNGKWITALIVSIALVAAVVCVYLNELRHAWRKWQDMKARRRERDEKQREQQRELDEPVLDPAPAIPVPVTAPATPTPAITPEAPAPIIAPEVPAPVIARETPAPVITRETQSATVPTGSAGEVSTISERLKPEVPHTDDSFSITAPEIEVADDIEIDDPGESELYDHRAELPKFRFPTPELLEDRPSSHNVDMDEQQANKDRIVKTLLDYKIPISKIEATVGPTVTLYEIVPAEGVRISQIKRLEDDIALSLAALGIRIIAPIPGKGTVGIEVPNRDPQTVSMLSVITSRKFQECKMALPMALGATISNDIFIADMAKMPHLLVAGATGMGKSVGLNAILASLLYKKHPSELKLVLVDPKRVEFSLYNKLERHYLAKLPDEDDAIIIDMEKVLPTLNSLCVEMENRYELLTNANVRSIEEYNKKFTERRLNPEKGHKYLPYIVVVVDEFADLIMTKGKEIETPIARIAQKARAVGIHMILATQRPSTNIITGLIKANFPGRVAFRVIQMVDSRTILDCPGANQLIGKGDMLFSHNGNMQRVQCAFISTEEVENIVNFIDEQIGYEHAYYLPEYVPENPDGPIAGASTERDSMFDEAARFVVSRQVGSTSSLQRQFGIGYNRAGKLMDQMEAAGIVGPLNGSKPRNILVDMMGLDMILGQK